MASRISGFVTRWELGKRLGSELEPALACTQIQVLWSQATTPGSWALPKMYQEPVLLGAAVVGEGLAWERSVIKPQEPSWCLSPRVLEVGGVQVVLEILEMGQPNGARVLHGGGKHWSLKAMGSGRSREEAGVRITCASLWGAVLGFGSQSSSLSNGVPPFLTWICGSRCCARSRCGRGVLLGKGVAGRSV